MSSRTHRAEPWIGIDVSKATFDAALWGHQALGKMATAAFPRTEEGARAFRAWARAFGARRFGVVMEATGSYATHLARWLRRLLPKAQVAIVNPLLVKAFGRSLALRNKTDRLDARLLARYGEERRPAAWVPLPPERAELRDLLRTRAKLLRLEVALRHRSGDGAPESLRARQAQGRVLEALQAQVTGLDRAIDHLLDGDPELGPAARLLGSIPGVGRVTAATLLGEAGDLRAFRRGRQLAAYLGLSPRRNESGTSLRGRTRMCRAGGRQARVVLFMAALSASRTATPLGDFYRGLVARGKAKRAAIGALMRKLVLVMRAVLIQNAPYERRIA